MPEDETVDFVCPACEEHIEVNPSMRDALLEHGCVVCGATVSAADFSAD